MKEILDHDRYKYELFVLLINNLFLNGFENGYILDFTYGTLDLNFCKLCATGLQVFIGLGLPVTQPDPNQPNYIRLSF